LKHVVCEFGASQSQCVAVSALCHTAGTEPCGPSYAWFWQKLLLFWNLKLLRGEAFACE